MNASNIYYTTGENDIIFIEIGFNNILILDYTYPVNKHIFQNYTIHEHTINIYALEFILHGTSSGYGLQSIYNGRGFIG